MPCSGYVGYDSVESRGRGRPHGESGLEHIRWTTLKIPVRQTGVNLGYEKCRTVRGMSPRSSCSGAQEEAMMQDGLWC